MAVRAQLRYLRIAPRKVRLVADLIRKKPVEEAETILKFTTKRAALPLLKLLKQAIANAKNNFQLDESNLYIEKILVNEGPKYKRWIARARGRADEIQKKTSHVTIVLEEIEKGAKRGKEGKEEKIAKKEKLSKVFSERKKLRPEKEIAKPKIEKGIKKIFKRKAF